MLTAILRSLRTGVVTIDYPAHPARIPERFRGAPAARVGAPFDALPPPSCCPSGAIAGGPGEARQAIDLGRCLFCGRCADEAAGAIELGRQVELASRSRERLVVTAEPDAEGRVGAPPPPRPEPEVAERIVRTLG